MNRPRHATKKRQTTHARGRKGRPTPKNTPGSRTRQHHVELQARRSNAILKAAGVERALDLIRAGDRGEKAALEQLARESGGVLLNPLKEKKR